MKADTERTIRYKSDLHKRKDFLHVHLSKDLRKKMKKRATLVKKGDKVRVMVGNHRGKEAKVTRVKYKTSKIYLEGLNNRTARAKEVAIPFEPSNLMLIELNTTEKGSIKVEQPKNVEKTKQTEKKTEERKEENLEKVEEGKVENR